jgi:hypothetical protein
MRLSMGMPKGLRLLFFKRMQVIQPLNKQQVGDLFNHRKRVANAARPEGIPNLINLIPEFHPLT